MPRVCQHFVVVVIPDHTHLPFSSKGIINSDCAESQNDISGIMAHCHGDSMHYQSNSAFELKI